MPAEAQVEVLDGWSRLTRSVPSSRRGADQLVECLAELTGVPLGRVREVSSTRNRIADEGTSSVTDTEARRVAETIRELQEILDRAAENHVGERSSGPGTDTDVAAVLVTEVERLSRDEGAGPGAAERALAAIERDLSNYGKREDVVTALARTVRDLRQLKNDKVEHFSELLAASGRRFRMAFVSVVPAFSDALRILVQAYSMTGRADMALPLAREYVALRSALVDELGAAEDSIWERGQYGDALNVLGCVLRDLERFVESVAVFQQAVALARETAELADGADASFAERDLAAHLVSLSLTLSIVERPEEALEVADEAVRLRSKFRPHDSDRDPKPLAAALKRQASCLYDLDREPAADKAAQEAARIYRELGIEDKTTMKAKIVFLRPFRFIGAMYAYNLHIDGAHRARIRCKEEFTVEVEPGVHTVQARIGINRSESLTFKIPPGHVVRIKVAAFSVIETFFAMFSRTQIHIGFD